MAAGDGRSSSGLTLVHSVAEPSEDGTVTIVHAATDMRELLSLASVVNALDGLGMFRQVIVYTGKRGERPQLSDVLPSRDLDVRERWLDVDAAESATHLAQVLMAFSPVLEAERPALLVVAGDDSGTLACALAAGIAGIPVARLGAGLRSWDWSAPDEINRVLIDRLADTLLTSDADAAANLTGEGIPSGRIHHVGNTLVDVLPRRELRERAAWGDLSVDHYGYVLLALQNPGTVVDSGRSQFAGAFAELASRAAVVLMAPGLSWHPDADRRAASTIETLGVVRASPRVPLDALSLIAGAGAVVTDDGAVQELSSALGVDCFTLGSSTERTATLIYGTNTLLGSGPAGVAALRPSGRPGTPCAIRLWDGHAGERAAQTILANYVLQRQALTP